LGTDRLHSISSRKRNRNEKVQIDMVQVVARQNVLKKGNNEGRAQWATVSEMGGTDNRFLHWSTGKTGRKNKKKRYSTGWGGRKLRKLSTYQAKKRGGEIPRIARKHLGLIRGTNLQKDMKPNSKEKASEERQKKQ